MRTYRFVRFLGDRVAAASREVAATTEHERNPEERLPAEAATDPHARVRHELPRAVVGAVDGETKGATTLSATTVSLEDREGGPATPAPELGVVIQASVPDFEHVNAMVARTVHADALADPEYSLAEERESEALDRMLAVTADAFVFVVTGQGVEVVPAQSIAALTDPKRRQHPHRDLYARRLGRTVEEFAEGFLGDATIAPGLSATDERSETESALREWADRYDLSRVLWIGIDVADGEEPSTLRDFV
ncbi:MAG: hypothetical protein ABEJ76_02965 [Halanaeroarchaeum sp.]